MFSYPITALIFHPSVRERQLLKKNNFAVGSLLTLLADDY